jgi:type VI secretion system secreted protein Hcp
LTRRGARSKLAAGGGVLASNIHIKLDGVAGESVDSRHAGEIEVQSWSWGVSSAGSVATGAGSGAGKATFNDLTFVHRVDRATPKLWELCATGKHVKDAKLASRKAGGPAGQDYLVITLKDVVVTSVSTSQSEGGGAPVEFVGLRFSKVDLEYKPQKPDGSLGAGIHFKFDLKTHKVG